MGPYEGSNYPFDLGGIAGVRRFLERVCGLKEHITEADTTKTKRLLHKTIKKAHEDIATFKFNTTISAMMMFVNHVEKEGIAALDYEAFLKVLAPFAPHLTAELWEEAGKEGTIHEALYPVADDALAADDEVTIGVQINGKMRGSMTLPPTATEAEALAVLAGNEDLQKRLVGTTTVKVIYVAGRILNLIVKEG
jgi:leucyl-tRNA synthetase